MALSSTRQARALTAEAAREKAVANLQKSRQEGSGLAQQYAALVAEHGDPAYARVDAPATREQKAALGALSADAVTATELAGEPITGRLTEAPGNGAAIGGLKVTTESAWFAALGG